VRRYVVAIFLLTTFGRFNLSAQNYYGGIIKADAKTYGIAKPSIDDLKLYLGKATGVQFILDNKDTTKTTGIQAVFLDRRQGQFEARLDTSNADEALIKSDGEHFLRIEAYTEQGLINGIYTYLDTLGIRFYHPGDAWTYMPQLKDIRLKMDEILRPDFALRTFFGTWGTPRNKVVDPKAIVDQAWQTWARRNRMGGAYTLKGHSWNEFLWRNYSPLNDHREMMALVNGTRVAPNTAAKFCVSNKDLQALFVKDMVKQLHDRMLDYPGESVYCISVEPSDGEGFCECDQCRKIGGISEQVFFLANVVAREFQKISPKAYVNLYAYNTHAAPPSFAIEPNVIVQIIPYGYQHFTSPQEMMEAWKKKGNKLFIYDYYGLPIENVDMPLKGELRPAEFAKRVNYWYQQHIIGATLESSYSIGATGLGLYVFGRLGWNMHTDIGKMLEQYYSQCYGKAGTAVEETEEVISSDTMDKNCALRCAMQHLQKQTAKLKLDERQKTCLTYFKAYLHYLKLLYDVQREDRQIEPLASDSLMQYTYGIFQTMMVHQFPINEYLKTHGPSTDYIKQHWDGFKPNADGMKFSTVVPLTEEQIEKDFEEDCKAMK
jgi:hypothetical protein